MKLYQSKFTSLIVRGYISGFGQLIGHVVDPGDNKAYVGMKGYFSDSWATDTFIPINKENFTKIKIL